MKSVSGGVAGVCVVRDAVDLIAFACGHYLRAGFAHLAFVDDGSSDGTFELLSQVARRTPRVSVRRVSSKAYRQAELVNEAANGVIRNGHSIVVPFDCDEFWNVEARDLLLMSEAAPEILFHGHWVNFVQSRECKTSGQFSLLKARYRAPLSDDADQVRVSSYSHSFVCHPATKIAFKTQGAVEINRGQHGLIEGPQRVCDPPIEVFHLPLRSRQEIVKRGLNYEPRRIPLRFDPRMSWQSAFHRDVVTAGKVDAVWAACSADKNGFLDVYGKPLPLIPDDRLRRTFMQAAWYMFKSHGLVAFRRGAARMDRTPPERPRG